MTFRQIEKIKYFLEKLKGITTFVSMEAFVSELNGYYLGDFNVHLNVYTFNTVSSYKSDLMIQDKVKIQNFLEHIVDEDSRAGKVFEILTLIDEGKSLGEDKQKAENYVAKIYHSYCGEVAFSDVIKAIATQHGVPGFQVYKVDSAILNGVLSNLRQYADNLCLTSKEPKKTQPNTVFNINNTSNSNSEASIYLNINQVFEQAKQQAEDAGLPDEQFKVLIKKLNELEEVGKSKESKGIRWQKAKEIMKWLVEQGIQVAGIVVPVLAACIK